MDPGEDPLTPNDGTDSTAVSSMPSCPTSLSHHIAKKLPLLMPLNTISSKFGVKRFAGTLKKFLQGAGSLHPTLHPAIDNVDYQVFKQFTIKIPSPLSHLASHDVSNRSISYYSNWYIIPRCSPFDSLRCRLISFPPFSVMMSFYLSPLVSQVFRLIYIFCISYWII